MIRDIDIMELEQLGAYVLVDVRSEGEYAEATIPGAYNIPLLNNQERAEVGTLYTQGSPRQARELGLRLISPKLPELVAEAQQLAAQGPLVLFCWRGGMRSKSLATVLDLMGLPVYRIQGGYKEYRHQVLSFFEGEFPMGVVVLRGNTGVGKTELLARLRQDGYPAIDLEKLANNRGSVFGDVGLGDPPSQKAFEAQLYEELLSLQQHGYVVVECESKRIGRVTLPANFFEAMQKGRQVLLYDSLPNRVERLVQEYTKVPGALSQIDAALERLVKNLGHERIKSLRTLLEQGQWGMFTEHMLLEYYDPLYGYPNTPDAAYNLSLNHQDSMLALRELESYLDQGAPSAIGKSALLGVRHSAKQARIARSRDFADRHAGI